MPLHHRLQIQPSTEVIHRYRARTQDIRFVCEDEDRHVFQSLVLREGLDLVLQLHESLAVLEADDEDDAFGGGGV
jgi:hypothetical protein